VAEEPLLREYEKTVDLFMSEDRTAWELVSIWIVLQVGLFSAFALLLSQQVRWGSIGYLILFSAGAITSLAWGFMQFRSKMWRENWLLFGLTLERQLKERCIMLNIFEFEHLVREEGIALEFFEGEIRRRNQAWWERIGALRLPHWAMFISAFVWFVLFLFSLKN